ncbi:aldehyde dehydrogenase family protein [Natrialba swarupiae]|nr:aldehyde dehydrogenase family protein [Natrialba swarupiae]
MVGSPQPERRSCRVPRRTSHPSCSSWVARIRLSSIPTPTWTAFSTASRGDGVTLAGPVLWQRHRLLVHEDAYDDVVPPLIDRLESVTIGDPFDESNTMGSVVSEPQFEKVCKYIDIAKEGADVLFGGETVDEYDRGYYLEPTVFEVEPDMTIAHEDVRAGALGDDLERVRRDDRDRQQHRLRPDCKRLDERPQHGTPGCGRYRVGLHLDQPARTPLHRRAVWRLQTERHREQRGYLGTARSHPRENINIEFSDDLTLAGGN